MISRLKCLSAEMETKYYDQVRQMPYDEKIHPAAFHADAVVHQKEIIKTYTITWLVMSIGCVFFNKDPYSKALVFVWTFTCCLGWYWTNKRAQEAESNIQNMLANIRR